MKQTETKANTKFAYLSGLLWARTLVSALGLVLCVACNSRLEDKKPSDQHTREGSKTGESQAPFATSEGELMSILSRQGQLGPLNWHVQPLDAAPDRFHFRFLPQPAALKSYPFLSLHFKAMRAHGHSLLPVQPLAHESAEIRWQWPQESLSYEVVPGKDWIFRVPQGSIWQVKVMCGATAQTLVLCDESTIEIPRVLSIDRELDLNQNFAWSGEALWINRHGVLRTQGYELRLDVKRLRSEEGGFIGTFKQEQRPSSPGGAGQRPAPIILKAERAFGALEIVSLGQSGAHGGVGDPHASRAPQGRDGSPGATSYYTEWVDGGHMGRSRPSCSAAPTPPQRGHDGQRGHQGKRGGQAGAAGALRIEVQEYQNFELKVRQQAGSRGEGGEGGPGQTGGVGGTTEPVLPCAYDGPRYGGEGSTGPQGPKGEWGAEAGEPGPVCIIKGSQMEGACAHF